MRFLLDEQFDRRAIALLGALGHFVEHVGENPDLQGSSDEDLVRFLDPYDAFLTLDLHRQDNDWLMTMAKIATSSATIVKIRLSKTAVLPDDLFTLLSSRNREIISAIEDDAGLITVRSWNRQISVMSRQEVRAMLRSRINPRA